MKNENWTREELVLALNLYFKLPFGKLHTGTPDIQELATIIGRTVNSVAMRLNNFASLDPYHLKRGIGGLKNVSKDCVHIWNEFITNREELIFEAESVLAKRERKTLEVKYRNLLNDLPIMVGEDRMNLIKTRVNQSVFRQFVLANYNYSCAISGINVTDLLVASHIIPWSVNTEERLNPENGLCLSALHDRAFDKGLIGIDTDFRILISKELKQFSKEAFYNFHFGQFENKPLKEPGKYLPRKEFIEYHLNSVFRK